MAVLLLILAVVAGCAGDRPAAGSGDPTGPPSPLVDCAELAVPPPQAVAESGHEAGAVPLPAVTLPCFTGGDPVALPDLAGPAVVNLWASWCGPCRRELPLLQRYAERMEDRVHVLGVVTQDSRDRAAAFAADADVSFPAVLDRDGVLLAELPALGLPVTLFVVDGRIRYLHNAELDEESLAGYAAEHLGVDRP